MATSPWQAFFYAKVHGMDDRYVTPFYG